jgi:error-prone DNA polymerase
VPEYLVQRAAQQGYAGLAVTDKCTLAGVVKVHVEAKRVPVLLGGFSCDIPCI